MGWGAGQLIRLPVSASIGGSWGMAALGLAVAEVRLSSQVSPAAGGAVPIRSASQGGICAPSFWWNAVVEHKAQTHIGRFALVSGLGCSVYVDAPLYFNGGPFASRFKGPARTETGSQRLRKPDFVAARSR